MLFIALISGTSFSQEKLQSYIGVIKESYKNFEQLYEAKTCVFIDYSTIIEESGEKAGQKYEANVKCTFGNEKSSIISTEGEIYSDRSTIVTVVPAEKTITILKNPKKETGSSNVLGTLVNDSLYDFMQVARCEVMNIDGEKIYRIIVLLNKEGSKLLKVSSMEFEISCDDKTLKKVNVKFLPSYKVKSFKIIYNQIIQDYKDGLNFNSVLDYILVNGKLKEKYKSYNLVDYRK
ncbi:MAG: hypothetical protein A2W91_12970 [Bacteroidetes bacterium GWF2_38_335]|nr:MAG: hypothetical protein A2W91_12970 [Bacteroidetes bacterium GWF2_38_335]HBS86936.1 hypothetical protein [Bacteroidales bacterium]